MALNLLGVEAPAAADAFDPDGDMRQLADSLYGRIVAPVANVTARNALATSFAPTTSKPLYVFRADATAGQQIEFTTNGSTWYVVSPVLKPSHSRWDANGAQSTANATVTTLTVFPTSATATNDAPAVTHSAGSFTVNTAGVWTIGFQLEWGSSNTAQTEEFIYINGAQIARQPGTPWASNAAITRSLTAGDVVTFRVFQNSGGSRSTAATTTWVTFTRHGAF